MNLYLVIIGAILLTYVDHQTLANPNSDIPHDHADSVDDDKHVHKTHGWGYDGPLGPQDWPSQYPLCNESSQSPINIVPGKSQLGIWLKGITFEGYDIVPPPESMTITNNGHTVQMDVSKDVKMSIFDYGLGNKYRFAQLHFHWGNSDLSEGGSEHTIDGKKFSMELHLVHYRDTYNNLAEAAPHNNGLAVVGVLIEIGPNIHPGIDNIAKDVHRIMFRAESIQIKSFPLNVLLPKNTKHYYRYNGSLTTPGCHESVIWTVLAEPIQISQLQFKEFLEIRQSSLGKESEKLLVNNYRPAQQLNERTIYHSNQAIRVQIQDFIVMTSLLIILNKLL